jgi:hypothetical protein
MFGLGKYLLGIGGIAFLLLGAHDARVNHLRGQWKAKYEHVIHQAATVVIALQQASGNEAVDWQTAPGQIIALGETVAQLNTTIADQNAGIEAQRQEGERLKALAAEETRLAEKWKAQRDSALRRLSDMAISPGTRSDCLVLLKEADEALSIARAEGG